MSQNQYFADREKDEAELAKFPRLVFHFNRRNLGRLRMLIDAIKKQGRKDWKLEVRDITETSAHWEPTYRFSSTGRLVHNVIDAEFEFDSQGLIKRHRDRFDFWRWSRQALGAAGLLLGWTPFLQNKVRATARGGLEAWMKKGS